VGGIVGLGGGIGASRLWRALAPEVPPEQLTLVVNTADDLWMHGLRICPDLDTTCYALSGRQDLERGWGLRGESFRSMDALRELGHPVWFNLGDRDLATHLLRTGLLREGRGLSEVTQHLAAAMGVQPRVLPMTESEVATRVQTQDGRTLHYEEYLVLHGTEPPIVRVEHEGLAAAEPAPGVLEAIAQAELVVLAPSNPVASMAPILGLRGLVPALRATPARVVAVSPVVRGVPITQDGERRRAASRIALLGAEGCAATATAVAQRYAGFCDRFILDTADQGELGDVEALGLEVFAVPTLVHLGAPPNNLLAAILGAGRPVLA
jgi:LPPG:FO 2-phospho-L-lactate transferase